MSLLLLGKTRCFVCELTIDRRVEAAQLLYATPIDVGDVARNGRAWVHRSCWRSWPMRTAWASSASRILAGADGIVGVRCVFGRRTRDEILVTDTLAPYEWPIPTDRLLHVRDAVRSRTATTLDFADVMWAFAPSGMNVRLTTMHRGQTVDDLEFEDPDALVSVLETTHAHLAS